MATTDLGFMIIPEEEFRKPGERCKNCKHFRCNSGRSKGFCEDTQEMTGVSDWCHAWEEPVVNIVTYEAIKKAAVEVIGRPGFVFCSYWYDHADRQKVIQKCRRYCRSYGWKVNSVDINDH